MILDTQNPVQDHDPRCARELKPIRLALLLAALNEFKRAGFYKIYCAAKGGNNYTYSYFQIGQVENVGLSPTTPKLTESTTPPNAIRPNKLGRLPPQNRDKPSTVTN